MPNMEYQQTLAQKISYTGVGLHSGKDVLMTLCPAEPDTGIVFVRTDLPEQPEIPALPENVTATTLSAAGAEVFTVEHLMAALSMMHIDNCRVEMNSPEPPVTDGSAAVFCDLILKAGRVQQEAERKVYQFTRTISISPCSLTTATAFPLCPSTRTPGWARSILTWS